MTLLALLLAANTTVTEPVCMDAVLVGREGHQRLTLEMAATPQARQQGLMGRTDLGPDRGMLFVFPREQVWPFWMANTPLALDIAPLDLDGRILEILDGQPLSTTVMLPMFASRRTLEVRAGTLEALGAEPPHGALVLVGDTPCEGEKP